MMEPACFGKRNYLPHLRWLRGPAIWRILSKRKVATDSMVIIKVRKHMAQERNLIQDDDMIETLSVNRADKALHIGCLPWRSECGQNFADVQAFCLRAEGGTIDAVAVPEPFPIGSMQDK